MKKANRCLRMSLILMIFDWWRHTSDIIVIIGVSGDDDSSGSEKNEKI